MAPVIHIVRHAQGYHNLNQENHWLPDPDLTELGMTQCEELNKCFPYHDKITHLVASPLRRTIFTCQFSFAGEVKSGKKIIALPDAQEISLYPSDVGSDLAPLKKEFGDLVDFRLVSEGWNLKTPESKNYPEPRKLEARARSARLWLRDLVKEAGDDAHIVLVTHGGIVHFITEDWTGMRPERGTGWTNTEYRSYQFADPSGEDADASLVELPESQKRRTDIPLTATETLEMRGAYDDYLARDLKYWLEQIALRQANAKKRANGA